MFWIKFCHLLFGVTFFGAFIASFFYVQLSDKGDASIQSFTRDLAQRVDYFVFLPMIVVAMTTGLLLVRYKYYTYTTPWIVVAYTALTCVFFLVIKSAKSKTNKKIFVPLNIFVMIILAVIVHDAVMKHTIFEHLY